MPDNIDIDIGSAIPGGQSPSSTPPKSQSASPPPAKPSEPAPSSLSTVGPIKRTSDALDELRKKANDATTSNTRSGEGSSKSGQGDPGAGPTEAPSDKTGADPGKDGSVRSGDPGESRPAEPGTEGTPTDVEKVVFPESASVKAKESFETVKRLARERIQQAESKAAEALKEVETLKSKLEGKSPEEFAEKIKSLETELKELREFKRNSDIESAEEFQVFDKRVQRNTEAVLAKLAEWGMTKENVEIIRKAGLTNVNWDPIYQHMTPQQKRFVESRLLDVENAGIEKKEALEEARANADKFFQERSRKTQAQVEAAKATRIKTASELESSAGWLKAPDLPKDASPEQKKEHEAVVKFQNDLKSKIKVALDDTSPEMHATLAYGNAMAFYLSAQVEYLTKQLEAAAKEKETVASELAKIKAASKSKRPDEPSSSGSRSRLNATSSYRPGERTEVALDRLREEVIAAGRS
jgi:hypothetical protein